MAFTIRVNDGYCEYSYELPESFGEDISISDLAVNIYKALGLNPDDRVGKLTKNYSPTSKSE